MDPILTDSLEIIKRVAPTVHVSVSEEVVIQLA
jgi:hypothetical protein